MTARLNNIGYCLFDGKIEVKRKALTSVLVNAFLFSVFFIIFTPRFETNDDVVMMLYSSGAFTGEPSEYLIHINVVLSLFLKQLYLLANSINWYPLFIYTIQFLACTSILHIFLSSQRNRFTVLVFMVLFYLLIIPLLLNPQFTSTAFLIGIAGILNFIQKVDSYKHLTYKSLLIPILYLVLAGLIRREVFLAIWLFFAPIFILKLIETKSFRMLVLPIVSGIIFLIFVQCNYQYYNKLGTPNYMDYQKALGKTMASEQVNESDLREVGWSHNDLYLLKSWFWLDPETYTKEKIVQFADRTRSRRRHLIEASEHVVERLIMENNFVFVAFVLLSFSLLISNKKNVRLLIVGATSVILMYLFLSIVARLPHRVLYPPLVFLCLFSYLQILNVLKRNLSANKQLILVSLTPLLLYQTAKLNGFNNFNLGQHSRYIAATSDLRKLKDKLLIVRGGQFPYAGIPLFTNPQKYHLNILVTGWGTGSPVYQDILKGRQIKNPMKALLNSENLLLQGESELIQTFFRERYQKDVEFRAIEGTVYLKPVKIIESHT